jgi:hypothetical protein
MLFQRVIQEIMNDRPGFLPEIFDDVAPGGFCPTLTSGPLWKTRIAKVLPMLD